MFGQTSGVSSFWKILSAALVLGLLAGGWFFWGPPPQKQAVSPVPAPISVAVNPSGESPPEPPPAPEPPPVVEPMVVDLGGGRFSVGAVTFDRKTREITIPAAVNMLEGAVEYVLVGNSGKVHESVFVTNADARDIHIAALLLGVKPEPDLGPENAAAVMTRKGAVVMRIEWDRNGPPEKLFLNETVNLGNPTTKAVSGTLPSGAWLYNGSRIEADGVFAATRHGSIISIIRDDDSLINNPGASRDNDEIHTPNTAKLPKKDHPVRIILQVK